MGAQTHALQLRDETVYGVEAYSPQVKSRNFS